MTCKQEVTELMSMKLGLATSKEKGRCNEVHLFYFVPDDLDV